MPSIIALMLCLGFTSFLIKLDRRQFPGATWVLWLATAWMITVITKAIGNWFGMSGSSLEEGSPLDRNFLLLLMGIGIWVLAKRKFVLARFFREQRWLLILFVFMFISIAWSSVPFVSLKRWGREVIAIVMGYVVLTEEDPREAIASVVRRAVYILVPFSLVLVKYLPQYGVDYVAWSGARMWIGVTDEKNEFGQLMSFSVLFLVWDMLRSGVDSKRPRVRYKKTADIIVLGIALYLSKGSTAGYSAAALVMLVFALICYFGLMWLHRINRIPHKRLFVVFFLALIIYGTVTPLLGRLPVGDISASLGRNSTLTERTVNWATLVPVAISKGLVGHGVGGFWTSFSMSQYYFPAHNGYLEVVLVLGFTGLLLISIFLLSSVPKMHALLIRDFEWGALWFCWLAMALINNIAESSLQSFSNILISIPLWMVLLAGELEHRRLLSGQIDQKDPSVPLHGFSGEYDDKYVSSKRSI